MRNTGSSIRVDSLKFGRHDIDGNSAFEEDTVECHYDEAAVCLGTCLPEEGTGNDHKDGVVEEEVEAPSDYDAIPLAFICEAVVEHAKPDEIYIITVLDEELGERNAICYVGLTTCALCCVITICIAGG